MLTPDTMKRDGRYNWIGQSERLIYMRKRGSWHQFRLVGDRHHRVWCEVLDEDLHMLEETTDPTLEEEGEE